MRSDLTRNALALVTLLAFGCATVRVPIGSDGGDPSSTAGDLAQRQDVVPGQIELWLENGEAVRPAEVKAARDQAESALARALEGRHVAPGALGAADPVVVVRERGFARTESRRHEQTAAIVGMVVGFVVVVAVVVVVLVSSKGSARSPAPAAGSASGAPKAGAIPRSASAPPAAVPVNAPRATASAAPGSAPRASPIAPAGTPVIARAHHSPEGPIVYRPAPLFWPHFWFDFSWYYPDPYQPYVLLPQEPAPSEQVAEEGLPPGVVPPPPPDGEESPDEEPPGANADGTLIAGAAEPAPPEPPPPPPPLRLPELAPLAAEDRGFFSGDETLLQVDLLDRSTGQLLWTRIVRANIDARDPQDVSKLVDSALAGSAWARRSQERREPDPTAPQLSARVPSQR